jgi:hypothetical protein
MIPQVSNNEPITQHLGDHRHCFFLTHTQKSSALSVPFGGVSIADHVPCMEFQSLPNFSFGSACLVLKCAWRSY